MELVIAVVRYGGELAVERKQVELLAALLYACRYGIHVTKS